MNQVLSLCALTGVLLSGGCAWVKPTPGGERVQVLDAQKVANCKELGNTTVSLVDKIAGIDRNRQKVEEELQILARNSAASIDGDTVVPISDISDGRQRFTIYQCVGLSR